MKVLLSQKSYIIVCLKKAILPMQYDSKLPPAGDMCRENICSFWQEITVIVKVKKADSVITHP